VAAPSPGAIYIYHDSHVTVSHRKSAHRW